MVKALLPTPPAENNKRKGISYVIANIFSLQVNADTENHSTFHKD